MPIAHSESFTAVVTSNKMIVRAGPTASSQLLGYLSKGTSVTVLSYYNGIAYIELNGNRGYAQVADMKRADSSESGAQTNTSVSGTATVTASRLPVYASASTSSKLLGILGSGQAVTVLATNNGWARLQNGSRIGYALLNGLSIGGNTSSEATTPPSSESLSGTATVAVNSLKVYASPDIASTVIGVVEKGTTFSLLATNNGWAKLQNGSRIGYALLSGLNIGGNVSSATPAPTVPSSGSLSGTATVAVNNLKVYASPDVTATVIGVVEKGTSFTLLATNNGWAQLQNGSRIGYALLSGLNVNSGAAPSPTVEPETYSGPEAAVTAYQLYVYKTASVSNQALGLIDKGTKVTVLDYNTTWVKIYVSGNPGYVGYAKRSGLELTGEYHGTRPETAPTPTPTPAPNILETMKIAAYVNLPSAPIYDNTFETAGVIFTAPAGYKLNVLGYSGDWCLVANGGARGYMLKNTLVAVSDVTMEETMQASALVIADSLPVYQFASTGAPVLGTYLKGATTSLVSYKGEWAMIKNGTAVGYAKLSGLSIVSVEETPTLESTVRYPAMVTGAGAKLYTYATENSKLIATISAGEEITVLGYDDVWCLIERAGSTAYTLKSGIKLISEITIEEKESYPGIVTAASAPVYRYADTSSTFLGSIKKGVTFTVLGQANGWAKINMTGNKGYIRLSDIYVQMDEFISPTVKSLSATVVRSAAAYSCALENSEYAMGTIPAATNITATAYTDKWIRLTYNQKECYILKNTVSTESYTPLKSGQNTASDVLKLQKALENLGYFDGLPAGNYGSLTTSAVQRFQKQLGIEATGAADIATLRVLYSGYAPASPIRSTSLGLNSTGSDVLRLQTRLTYKGYMNGALDGEYGPITQKAVKLYQQKAGLSETGTADSATLKSLFSSSAPTNPAGAVSGGSSSNGNYSTDASDDPATGTGSSKTETVIEWALAQLGKKYVYGEEGPNVFDCSGFTQFCYLKVGVRLNRSAQSVGYNNGKKIESVSDLVRGDLVCFNTIDDNDLSDHVGIYLGNNKFIHASSGAGKVVISDLSSGYYKRVFSWGRRVL